MTARVTSLFAALGFVFAVLPSRAQYAFASLPKPETSAAADPEDGSTTRTVRVLHGVVQGKLGALPGATVWLHGTRTIVVTNAEGEFELPVPASAKVIELTCGYAGLQEEVVRFAPNTALGSVYLLRERSLATVKTAAK